MEEGCHGREGGRPLTTDSAKPRKVMNHFYDSLGHSSPIRGGRLSVSRYKRAFFPPRPGWNTSRKLPPTAVISRGGSRVTPSRRYRAIITYFSRRESLKAKMQLLQLSPFREWTKCVVVFDFFSPRREKFSLLASSIKRTRVVCEVWREADCAFQRRFRTGEVGARRLSAGQRRSINAS